LKQSRCIWIWEICIDVNHFASIRSRGWGANISLRKLVLRLNTDWAAAGEGRSLLQLFQSQNLRCARCAERIARI